MQIIIHTFIMTPDVCKFFLIPDLIASRSAACMVSFVVLLLLKLYDKHAEGQTYRKSGNFQRQNIFVVHPCDEN